MSRTSEPMSEGAYHPRESISQGAFYSLVRQTAVKSAWSLNAHISNDAAMLLARRALIRQNILAENGATSQAVELVQEQTREIIRMILQSTSEEHKLYLYRRKGATGLGKTVRNRSSRRIGSRRITAGKVKAFLSDFCQKYPDFYPFCP